MSVILIVAQAKNRVIGNKGALPWHLPEDLKHFKELTTGHAIIMGRKTWDSIGRPLPNRQNIVISRSKNSAAKGAQRVDNLESALALVEPTRKAFIIGGAEIYALAVNLADKIEMTVVDDNIDGDTYFPQINLDSWECTRSGKRFDEGSGLQYEFVTYRRTT